MHFIQKACREAYVSESSCDTSLSEGRLGVKDRKEKAMQGCLDLLLCFHPPIHPLYALYFFLFLFVSMAV